MRTTTNNTELIAYPFTSGWFDWVLFGAVLYIGFVFAWYIESMGLTLVFIDQYSHLSIARELTDSLTPGLSQLGFWPPLVHLLMAPFALFDPLFVTGLAAAFALVPIFALGAVFLYRSMLLFVGARVPALVAVFAYTFNPYLLYYAVTPMMETLFVALLMGVLYFTLHWWYTARVGSLVWLGVFVALASIARFEGFFLLPIVGLIILYRLWRRGAGYHEIEAVAHLFGLVAVLGVVFIFTYGAIFGGSPLAFMTSQWSAHEQQRDFARPAEYDWGESFTYLLHASSDMLGGVVIGVAVLSFVALLVFRKHDRDLLLGVMALLISPFLFDLLALYQGSIIIYIEHLPPYGIIFNERYGLYWIGAVILPPVLAAVAIYRSGALSRRTWPVGFLLASIILAVLVAGTALHFRATAVCPDCYRVVQSSWLASKPWRLDLADVLTYYYDGGMILVTRAFFNEAVVSAGIPLEHYVQEANDHYYDQAVDLPWLFARWVIMFNADAQDIPQWERSNERVSERWADDDEFHHFYELVYEQGTDRLYRIREERVRSYVHAYGLDPASVPVLSSNPRATWDVRTTYHSFVRKIKPDVLLSTQR